MDISEGVEFARHRRAAEGFCELAMREDASSELEAIEPEVQSFPGVLLLRLRIFAGMGKWESAAALAAGMVDRGIHELSVFLAGAEAIRKTCGRGRCAALPTWRQRDSF